MNVSNIIYSFLVTIFGALILNNPQITKARSEKRFFLGNRYKNKFNRSVTTLATVQKPGSHLNPG